MKIRQASCGIRAAAHLSDQGTAILKLEPDHIGGADLLAAAAGINVKLSAQTLENKVRKDGLDYLVHGIERAKRLGLTHKIVIGSGNVANASITNLLTKERMEIVTIPFTR